MATRQRLDPYAVLGVSRTASALQVARARRRLAKQFHPDLHPGEDVSEKMQRINEAWHILSSPGRRAAYDLDHPAAGTIGGAHWGAATRRTIRPVQPSSTRTWATWRASAEETRAAPRTVRRPGEMPVRPARRPVRSAQQPTTFRDSGWAALVAAVVILLILAASIAAGRLV